MKTQMLGVDFGTTNSAVGWHGKTGVALAKFGSNSTTFPSALCTDAEGNYIFGTAALKKMQKPGFFGVRWGKRLIGRTYTEAKDAGLLEKVPFDTKADPQNPNQILVRVAEDKYEPLVSTMGLLLDHLLSTAKKSLGVTTSRVYATVPAYFNDAEKRATSDIYEVAGYKVERVTSEPVAGAFFVLSQEQLQSSDTRGVLVFDKGGGTLDITILEQTPGEHEEDDCQFQVLAYAGNTFLGGSDIDLELANNLKVKLQDQGFTMPEDAAQAKLVEGQLLQQAEAAKIALTDERTTEVEVRGISVMVNRKDLADAVQQSGVYDKTKLEIENVFSKKIPSMNNQPYPRTQIKMVVMLGGSTKAEWTSKLVKEVLPHLDDSNIIIHEPDEACARGAAMLAERFTTNTSVNLKDTVALDVAIVVYNRGLGRSELDVVIPKGHHLPCQVQRKYTFRQGGIVSITVVEGVDIEDTQVFYSTEQDQGIVDVGTIYLEDKGSKKGDPVDVFLQQTPDRQFKVSAKSKNDVKAEDVLQPKLRYSDEELKKMADVVQKRRDEIQAEEDMQEDEDEDDTEEEPSAGPPKKAKLSDSTDRL